MMITTETIKQQTQKLVSEILPDVSPEELPDNVDIFSLGLDSINAMTLVSNLQDAFEIQLDASEISFENFQNIATIVEMIEKKKGL
ncbi:acyl carrier protein [Nostoc sp. UHCC 0870]|uniref:acyl carrier protein n=1 Tax=Nostoc sp. UHCC 0870 TaxID=2914041 RepID=UPI001EDE7B49|nr:acyl carrier protein [Nostoc sp. UHCC 0870]UKO99746.1 acyl carrier protein [Nostoc sp. UHCC 0870]